jgi:ribosomal protein L32
MQRILLVVVVLLVVWRVLATIGRRLSDSAPGADSFSRFSPAARRRRRASTDRGRPQVEELVECSICGTFVPHGTALYGDTKTVFCGENCRQEGAGGSSDDGR